jgi:hypothetical protein
MWLRVAHVAAFDPRNIAGVPAAFVGLFASSYAMLTAFPDIMSGETEPILCVCVTLGNAALTF